MYLHFICHFSTQARRACSHHSYWKTRTYLSYTLWKFWLMMIWSRWRHQMEIFSALLVICAGNSPVPAEFPAQRPVTRSFDVSLICVWINGWVNNREAGDLRRYHAHYDATVMDSRSQGIRGHGLRLVWMFRFQHQKGWYIDAWTKRSPFSDDIF